MHVLFCRDTFIVTLGNAITSILAGFAIFSVLGYMSQELGVPVDQVAKAGKASKQLSSLLSNCMNHVCVIFPQYYVYILDNENVL